MEVKSAVQHEVMIPVFVGYDPREAIAYHTFCNSVLRRSSEPVSFVPLAQNILGMGQRDGATQFTYSRFLVPWLMRYQGWAIYADGDMVCLDDVAKLWALRDSFGKALHVVKHDYQTKAHRKFLGNENRDYPRKNWSSLILWNCGHFTAQRLTPQYVEKSTGEHLHRFEWVRDEEIGELPVEWNWLAGEYPENKDAKLIHYTLGTPCFEEYSESDHAENWMLESELAMLPIGDVG